MVGHLQLHRHLILSSTDHRFLFRDVSGEFEVTGSDIDEDAGTGTVQVKANDGQVHDIGVKKIKGQWRVVGG